MDRATITITFNFVGEDGVERTRSKTYKDAKYLYSYHRHSSTHHNAEGEIDDIRMGEGMIELKILREDSDYLPSQPSKDYIPLPSSEYVNQPCPKCTCA